jgi:hypothetical protein
MADLLGMLWRIARLAIICGLITWMVGAVVTVVTDVSSTLQKTAVDQLTVPAQNHGISALSGLQGLTRAFDLGAVSGDKPEILAILCALAAAAAIVFLGALVIRYLQRLTD